MKKELGLAYWLNNETDLGYACRHIYLELGDKYDVDQDIELAVFWCTVFTRILTDASNDDSLFQSEREEVLNDDLYMDDGVTVSNAVNKSLFIRTQKNGVYEVLEAMRDKIDHSDLDCLKQIQQEIESHTLIFNEKNVYSQCPRTVRELIAGSEISAKDYLKGKYKFDKYIQDENELIRIKVESNLKAGGNEVDAHEYKNILTAEEKEILSVFGHHTIEALLIHIMSRLFWCENSVPVATLVDRIEYAVRNHAEMAFATQGGKKKFAKTGGVELRYPFGTALVEYLVERKLIQIVNKEGDSSKTAKKKNKSYYLVKSLHAECLINPAILPIQISLPMVHPPVDWGYDLRDKSWLNITDLYGGYLLALSTEVYERCRLLSSWNVNQFYIYFGKKIDKMSIEKADIVCNVMNKLQHQAFKINECFLHNLTKAEPLYAVKGLIRPRFLSYLNMNDERLHKLLREFYVNNKAVQGICTFNKVLEVLSKNIQRARYEQRILDMAEAYRGYKFYLPVFLDFRGRVYRCGGLNFHESDLVRSLILFDNGNEKGYLINDEAEETHYAAAAFHYKSSFCSSDEAAQWMRDGLEKLSEDMNLSYGVKLNAQKMFTCLTEWGVEAKNPFQFISKAVHLFYYRFIDDGGYAKNILYNTPITQDASASAYQLMSYFMLDSVMALRTNLVISQNLDSKIRDIYSYLMEELKLFLKGELDISVYRMIADKFDRKLVKGIFMPLIYGKTMMSTCDEIKAALSQYLTHKECFKITRLCFHFWTTKYSHMDCLIRLIRIIGWFATSCDRPVQYETYFFSTSQDYRVMDSHSLWVYDKKNKKRRKVTLRVSSEKRDSKKTEVSTFVNFIHQKDAFIAMKMVDKMTRAGGPIYTVHDNFISTTPFCNKLPFFYLEVFNEMGPPLKIVNAFFIQNLVEPHAGDVPHDLFIDDCMVFTPQMIDQCLEFNIPEKFRNDTRRLKVWKSNVSRLQTHYRNYCAYVCDEKVGQSRKKVGSIQKTLGKCLLHSSLRKNMNNMKNKIHNHTNFVLNRSYSTFNIILSLDKSRRKDEVSSEKFSEKKKKEEADLSFVAGAAIPLTLDDGTPLPKGEVLGQIYSRILKKGEFYDGELVPKIGIRFYTEVGIKIDILSVPLDERTKQLEEALHNQVEVGSLPAITTKKIRNRKKTYNSSITRVKNNTTKLNPFLVADTETLLLDNVHKPYAAGVMMVHPGDNITNNSKIDSYFSEDYSSFVFESFEARSSKLLTDFIHRIISIIKQNPSIQTVYFHNFSRFDGIFILKHLAIHAPNYRLKPLMRNNIIYELAVYAGNKRICSFRDSLHLLPGTLGSLAESLCPGLGTKGSIDHENVTVENVGKMKDSVLEYMEQDIRLLGGVMLNAQKLYWTHYKVDIVSVLTCSAMAIKIFRKAFYNDQKFPIHIPNRNEDTFIRRGYYGGHTDAYKQFGRNLFYYDVNSLYPFIMKEYPMPGGKPVWDGNLVDKDIDSLYGFIEAFVSCPSSVKKPFLPVRSKDGTLIFPTGDFVGVYYSEELKYARSLGYRVIPLKGYLFQKMESPFKEYVTTLYESRAQAKKDGNEALSFLYKINMNSLYGRFGINPNSTKTELCDSERYHFLMKQDSFIGFHPIQENQYMVSYHTVTADDSFHWAQPKNSAVQLSAAITACARIYMHPFISRDDCYYTDTDSIVLANPLPDNIISSKVLGLFKLEDKIKEGFFLAPKAYGYISEEDTDVIKFKGAAKHLVDLPWFREQLANPSRRMQVIIKNKFKVDWDKLTVGVNEYDSSLGIKLNSKRITQPDGDTLPIEVNDMCGLDHIEKSVAKSLMKKLMKLQTTNTILNEKLSQKEREREKRMDGVIVEERKKSEYLGINIETTLTEERTQLDKEESDVTKTDDKKPDT